MTMHKLTLATALALTAGAAQAADFPKDVVEHGRYIATASDCVACHTGQTDKPFGGNHVIASPVGDIVATNITPSKKYGIGTYSEKQFSDAVRRGVRADGANLYPAMPYTSYAKLTDADIHALYAYFMTDVKPVEEASAQTKLPFPFNIRASMMGWNLLFRDSSVYKDVAGKSAEWNRGAYLVEGPAHCSTCHTPRGVLMQEEKGKYLGGAQVGAWYAPNITSDPKAGIGSWSQQEIVDYLSAGRAEGKAQAGGSMAEAVEHSFSKLSTDDLNAIATYIRDVPPISGPTRFDQGGPANMTADFRGVKGTPKGLAAGAQVYSANCASCHGIDGQGTGDPYYPSLYHNSATAGASAGNFIATVLNGVDRKTDKGHVFMPPFGTQVNAFNALSDQEVAELANYVYAKYGNAPTDVTAADVAQIRAGGPQSNLLGQVRSAMWILGALVVILLLCLFVWWRRRRR